MKVLLLEDHDALRALIAEHLAQRGFTVDAVGRGEEAFIAVATTVYDAVLLDLGLPDIDGMAVLAALQSQSKGRLPALIVTARDSVDDRVRGLNAGADDYLIKPFDLAELEARLRAVLRRPGARHGIAYSYGDLSFDAASREVAVKGAPLDLSRRETALFEELVRAAGQVVVKDTLQDRLYSFDEPVTTNALEATVSRLRKKLTEVRSTVQIDTKRGIGYRLIMGSEP